MEEFMIVALDSQGLFRATVSSSFRSHTSTALEIGEVTLRLQRTKRIHSFAQFPVRRPNPLCRHCKNSQLVLLCVGERTCLWSQPNAETTFIFGTGS